MYLTGFADEAGDAIEVQIRATKALGWENIESRSVKLAGFEKSNIHDIPDPAFDRLAGILSDAGVKINCFGSAIGNWGKKIEDPFDVTLAEIRRAIPRMQRLGTKLVRIMSYAVRDAEDQMEQERFRRVREIRKMFADAGLTVVHENCMNYGGMGWPFTVRLLENVPGLKLVFDTGNPIFSDDRSKPVPHPKQSSWEFYEHVRDHVAYIHIKDGQWNAAEKKCVYSFPGEGAGDVRRIMKDLLRRGYDGGVSIEPHMGAVFHDPAAGHNLDAEQIYVEYGRRMMKLLDGVRAELQEERGG